MKEKNENWFSLNKNQVINKVNNIRREATGSDKFRTLDGSNMAMVKDSPNIWFLRFNISFVDEEGKFQRILGYRHLSLFLLLRGKVHLFIDATFRLVPHPFYQCLIILVWDVQCEIYVPVMYILMTGKSHAMY